jgi:hypothetical protein
VRDPLGTRTGRTGGEKAAKRRATVRSGPNRGEVIPTTRVTTEGNGTPRNSAAPRPGTPGVTGRRRAPKGEGTGIRTGTEARTIAPLTPRGRAAAAEEEEVQTSGTRGRRETIGMVTTTGSGRISQGTYVILF